MATASAASVESLDLLLIPRIVRLMGWTADEMGIRDESRHQGPRQKLLAWQIMVGLVAQCLHFHGCFAHIIWHYFQISISDSALSQRRQKMHLEAFLTVMRHALKPMARRDIHSGCFFGELRLVGIDGTQLNLVNTPQINAQVSKVRTRRGEAAFAKLSLSVLVELGTHAPLGAAMSLGALSEKVLCQQLWEALPPESLLILDRLYGQAPMLQQLQEQCMLKGSHFLVRVRDRLNVQVQQLCEDGSAQVAVTLRERNAVEQQKTKGKTKHTKIKKIRVSYLSVREVRGRVYNQRAQQWLEVRLWTSLSVQQADAKELLALYARRWEQEIFYKELKLQVNQGDLLRSQRTETAIQQIAALMIACSLLAEERLAVAAIVGGEVAQAGAVRISFSLCHEHTMALFLVLQAAQGLMDKPTQGELVMRVRAQIALAALPPRRSRSCQRKVRRPIDKWPRMLSPTSLANIPNFTVTPFA